MSSSTVSAPEIIDYYLLLDLQPDWSIDQLRKEILGRLQECKSRVNATSGEKKEQLELRMNLIPGARKILTDPESKAIYDKELAESKRTATPDQHETAAGILTLAELWALIDCGRYLDAIEAGKKLITQEPENDRGWEVYGYANYRWNDFNTAIYATEQAIRCNPSNAEYYADAGQYLAAANRWDEARVQLNRAIQVDPKNVGYKLVLSEIHIQHEAWGDAEAVLQGVLSQEPSNQTARSFMAILISSKAEARFPEIDALIEANKKREARKILKEVHRQFEEASKLAENDPDLRELLNSESFLVRRVLGVNFYRRILGLVIDFILVLPAILLMSIDNGSNPIALAAGSLLMLGIIGYSWIWLAFKNNGQDLTKRLLGMQIISDSDSISGLSQIISRAILKPIAIGLGGLFPFLVFMFSMFSSFSENSGSAAGTIGMIIGISIGMFIFFFKFGFDLFFVTSKQLLPNFFGLLLFLHEHLTKTTVINSTKDDFLNFGEYHWY